MKSFTLTTAAILALTTITLAQPKYMPHHNKKLQMQPAHGALHHEKRAPLVVTEVDYFTEVATDYTTVWVTPTPAKASEAAPAVASTTKAVQQKPTSSAAENVAQGAAFYQSPAAPVISSHSSASDIAPSAPVAAPPAPSTTLATSAKPTVVQAAAASPSPPPSSSPAPAPASSGSTSGTLYNLPAPPSRAGASTQCSASSPCPESEITFYTLSDSMACAYTGLEGNDDTMAVLALPVAMMGTASSLGVNQPANPNCGRVVHIEGPSGSTQAVVVDKCMGCVDTHIDLSAKAFTDLGVPQSQGTAMVTWHFVD